MNNINQIKIFNFFLKKFSIYNVFLDKLYYNLLFNNIVISQTNYKYILSNISVIFTIIFTIIKYSNFYVRNKFEIFDWVNTYITQVKIK